MPRSSYLLAGLVALSLAGAADAGGPADAKLTEAQAAMVVDPKKVLTLVAAARATIEAAPRSADAELAEARASWLESEALGRLGELDRAEQVAAPALRTIERLAPGTKLHGDLLMALGGVALDQNRMQRAFGLFRQAHAIYQRAGEQRAQALALQNIGIIYTFAGDQRSVLRYYAQAAETYRGDASLAYSAANNVGAAHKELGQLERAEAEFRRALVLTRQMGSAALEARVLTNLASVALLRGRLDEAAREADRGLRAARSGDAAEWVPFLWGVKAQIALRRGDLAGAVRLLDQTFAGHDLAKTSFYFRDFHQTASDAYLRAGNPALAMAHLGAFKRLDDEAREIRSSTNAALSAAQFDYSNQELKIVKLEQGQLKQRARQQLLMLGAALTLFAVTLAAFFWVRRSRNQTRAANRQLETANGALDKALKAKSEFLATTSHEIRTPLNGILGMTQVLMRRRGLVGEVRDQVRLIDSAGNTMKAIVDDILDMAQIEQGRVEVICDDIALPDMLAMVAGLWRPAAEAKGVALIVDLDAAPERIVEDERKLRQITYNLLSNAIKFTAAGTVRLHVFSEGEDGAERLVVAVEDSGIGIAADQIAPIFEPFRQADGGTTRTYGGTGLGLAISSKLAQALGGDIGATSEVGVGSRFALTLPLTRAEAPVVVAAASGERPTVLAEATVALVESNPLFASMIEAVLAREVRAVLAVEDAAEVAAADIVLLADEESLDAVAELRARLPGALLVRLGEGDTAGCDGIVAKTMPPLHLGEALATLLAASVPIQAAA